MDNWNQFVRLCELYPGSSLTKMEDGWEVKIGEFKYTSTYSSDPKIVIQEALLHLMCMKLSDLQYPKDFDKLING